MRGCGVCIGLTNLPAVFHRINNHKTVVTMRLEDWVKLYDEYSKNLYKN